MGSSRSKSRSNTTSRRSRCKSSSSRREQEQEEEEGQEECCHRVTSGQPPSTTRRWRPPSAPPPPSRAAPGGRGSWPALWSRPAAAPARCTAAGQTTSRRRPDQRGHLQSKQSFVNRRNPRCFGPFCWRTVHVWCMECGRWTAMRCRQ